MALLFKFQAGLLQSKQAWTWVEDWNWNCGLLIFFCCWGISSCLLLLFVLFCFEIIKTKEDLCFGSLVCRVLPLPHHRSNIDQKTQKKNMYGSFCIAHKSSSAIAGWSACSAECVGSFCLLLLFVYLKSQLFEAAPSQRTNQDGTFTDLVLRNWLWLSLGNTTHVCLFLNALGEVKEVAKNKGNNNNPQIPRQTPNVLFGRVYGTDRILWVTGTRSEWWPFSILSIGRIFPTFASSLLQISHCWCIPY